MMLIDCYGCDRTGLEEELIKTLVKKQQKEPSELEPESYFI